MHGSREINYSHPEPAAWTDITHVAQEALYSAGVETPNCEAVEPVLDALHGLSDEDLDRARYHGLGLVMQGTMERLSEPGQIEQLTSSGARQVAETWRRDRFIRPRGLLVNDLSPPPGRHFSPITQAATDGLPPEEHLAIDLVSMEAYNRQSALKYGHSRYAMRPERMASFAADGDWTAERVNSNVLSAAYGVVRATLRGLHQHHVATGTASEVCGDPQREFESHVIMPSVPQALDGAGLDELDLVRLSQRCAALRSDEFMQDLKGYIGTTSEGKPTFLREHVVPSRELAPPEVFQIGGESVAVLHAARLRCPALFVDGLIPTAVGMTADIITEAQARIEHMLQQREIHGSSYFY
ncbi:MAG TPA: hypothetical protein VJP80_02590 [Candidatus Saccharimonadales bacterium]|nr:hypothetical protein [Candidatus Saccharimonadales bacterium]